MDQNWVGIIISVFFLLGTAFHLQKRRKHIVSCYVKSTLKISLRVISVVFILMAHFLRGEVLDYLVALSAVAFILSSVYSQGISKKGVCYFTGTTFILSTASWKDIQKAVISKGEILGIEYSGKTLRLNHVYKGKDEEKVMGILQEKNLVLEKGK